MENSTFTPLMETTYPEDPMMTTTEEPVTTTEEPTNIINGYIFHDKNPMENVLVTNLSNNLQTISDKSGYYDIIGNTGDNLLFEKYGYEKKYIYNVITNYVSTNIDLIKNNEDFIWFIFLIYLFLVLNFTCIVSKLKVYGLDDTYPNTWGTWIAFCVICWILLIGFVPNFFPVGFAVYTLFFVVYLALSLFFIIKSSIISKILYKSRVLLRKEVM